MAASLCLKFIFGGKILLEWQTYTVDLNNGSLLILLKILLLLISLCRHFFLYSLSLPPLVSFFVAFLMFPVLGSGQLKLGWGHLCPHPSFKCPEPNTGHIKNDTKKDTRGGSNKEYKKKWRQKEINNSKNLSKINNEPLFKSTVYVCHSNSVFPTKMNLRQNDAAIDSGCTTHTWPLTAPVQNIQNPLPLPPST